MERDEFGHIRFAEVDLARKVKVELQGRLKQRGINVTVTNKNIGYELRCADPIPFDANYCRNLGNAAVRFLLDGGSSAMVSIQDGQLVPLSFSSMRDPKTGKTRVRNVDPHGPSFMVARNFMIRLDRSDLENRPGLGNLAKAANLTVEEFVGRFGHLMT